MAIYRFEAKVISRGGGGSRSAVASASYRTGKFANSGKSAVSAAAYRAGAMLIDERTGQRYDYESKRGVLGAEIMAPPGAVAWVRDRQQLWAAVERIEKRKDAQLARDFILTLPAELSPAQRVALTREFVAAQFCARGFVADIAWHAPGKGGDERNYHAHVMVPMRRIEGEGFAARKHRPAGGEHPAKAWAAELAALRIAWADTANQHLEAAGLDIRVDHRSLAEQGIDRIPEPKLGPLATQIERQGRDSLAGNDNRDVKARNAELAALKAELAGIVAEENHLAELLVQDLRSGAMQPVPVNEEELRLQQQREADALRELQRQEERTQAFRRQIEAQAEETRKQQEQLANDAAYRRSEGEIASASARYSVALGDHYDIRDPYGSLSRASMAEYGALVKGQEQLRQQAAKEPDAGKRREIELRREIEAHDYMALSSQRLAGISATIAGREDAPQAMLNKARADLHAEQATELRHERAALIVAREQREQREQQQKETAWGRPDQPASPARPDQAGRAVEPKGDERRQDDEARAAVTGRKEGDAELSDAQRAKLDRLQATREFYADHQAQKQKDRDRGGGGRSGR